MTRLGRGALDGFLRIRGACCGRGSPGDGGGEWKARWSKPKREELEDSGPLSAELYEAALRRLIRGGEIIILDEVTPWCVTDMVGGAMVRRRSTAGPGEGSPV